MAYGEIPSSPSCESPPSSSSPSQKNNLPMLYYGLVVFAIAAIVPVIYNLLVIRWCRSRERQRPPPYAGGSIETEPRSTSQSFQLSRSNLLESSCFKYKKDIIYNNNVNNKNMGSCDYDHECSVCLSEFEDGEEVRLLPMCNHSFHAPCIDMWLYSHYDCPLCRATVHIPTPPPPPRRHNLTVGSSSPENSREGLLDSNVPV